MKVLKYNSRFKEEWNRFVECSNSATFLFQRDFLEYHANRFRDFSLIVVDDNNKIVALLPANITLENVVISHQGLTYGGFALSNHVKLQQSLLVVHCILKFLCESGIDFLDLKCLPWFYNVSPSDELEYAMFLLTADLYRRDIAFVIDMDRRIPYTGNIRREGNKAQSLGAEIKEDDSLAEFWDNVLEPNLMQRYGVKPVHSLAEIVSLKNRFPENIKQYNAYLGNQIVAGTTMFLNKDVAHCQYISSTEQGRKTGSLNFLFKYLLDNVFSTYRYFDFGIVNENNGRSVNAGMLFWKEAFGGRAQRHDFYKIATANYKKLETFIS